MGKEQFDTHLTRRNFLKLGAATGTYIIAHELLYGNEDPLKPIWEDFVSGKNIGLDNEFIFPGPTQALLNFHELRFPSRMRWRHRINSTGSLHRLISSRRRIHAIETDVMLFKGGKIGAGHPPKKDGDSLSEFLLDFAYQHPDKTLKLDFKHRDIVHTSLNLAAIFGLKDRVIPSGCVTKGPSGGPGRFTADEFIDTCLEHLPDPVISLSWTVNQKIRPYTETMVENMLGIASRYPEVDFTFAVNVGCAYYTSDRILKPLLESPKHSITYWQGDYAPDEYIFYLMQHSDPRRSFYDIPRFE